jgi:response regulator RpfG family c-di-GMP phosphodiesterase
MSNYLASHLDTEKKTVMICDDEQDLRQLFGIALKSKYNVILVDSGEDCIDKYIDEKSQGNKIHLILLDYRLGGMFGDSVARKIKEYNGTKIILISCSTQNSTNAGTDSHHTFSLYPKIVVRGRTARKRLG